MIPALITSNEEAMRDSTAVRTEMFILSFTHWVLLILVFGDRVSSFSSSNEAPHIPGIPPSLCFTLRVQPRATLTSSQASHLVQDRGLKGSVFNHLILPATTGSHTILPWTQFQGYIGHWKITQFPL